VFHFQSDCHAVTLCVSIIYMAVLLLTVLCVWGEGYLKYGYDNDVYNLHGYTYT